MELFPWQEEIITQMENEPNAILSSPTGSGKTIVAYTWSGIWDRNIGKYLNPSRRVIFTAPIKALSNERYFDLKEKGLDVGIETGDIKNNINAPILCCTQEIYTLKYAKQPGQKVIMDEMHYIFTNHDRSRAYIDGIKNTHPESHMLCMSATFGNPQRIQKYLAELRGQEFKLFANEQRVTNLIYENHINKKDIENALVFVFSYRGVIELAEEIASTRSELSQEQIDKIEKLSEKYHVIPEEINFYGVGTYYGGLLPKEKFFIEEAFRSQLIDVVVGTDALALGVNLPAEKVVFAQLAKYYDGPITKNEFLQMAGRAGRYKYYDTGKVYYTMSDFESFMYDTADLYENLLKKQPEEPCIILYPKYEELIKGTVSPEEEAEFISQHSIPTVNYHEALEEIQNTLETIDERIDELVEYYEKEPEHKEKVIDILKEIYHPELYPEQNVDIAFDFSVENYDLENFVQTVSAEERNYFYGLLKARKILKTYPKTYTKHFNINLLDKTINEIDHTVLAIDEDFTLASRKEKLKTAVTGSAKVNYPHL